LSFFNTLASECEPFLRKFQSSEPFAPFLFEHLHRLVRTLMKRCVKADILLHEASTVTKLLLLDLELPENLLDVNNVGIGFATKKILKSQK
jgi:hypothetical protein